MSHLFKQNPDATIDRFISKVLGVCLHTKEPKFEPYSVGDCDVLISSADLIVMICRCSSGRVHWHCPHCGQLIQGRKVMIEHIKGNCSIPTKVQKLPKRKRVVLENSDAQKRLKAGDQELEEMLAVDRLKFTVSVQHVYTV